MDTTVKEIDMGGGVKVKWEYDTEVWYLNGKVHRDNGPAIIYPDGK